MNPFQQLIDRRSVRAPAVAARPRTVLAASRTEQIRQLLREQGPLTAFQIATHVELESTGRVGALLKQDIARGRITCCDGSYSWNPGFDQQLHGRLARAARLLRNNGYKVVAP